MKKIIYIILPLIAIFLTEIPCHAQLEVSGTVRDSESGDPLPGVNIVEKRTSNGVISDINGNYSISTERKKLRLVFSYIGYLEQEITFDSSG